MEIYEIIGLLLIVIGGIITYGKLKKDSQIGNIYKSIQNKLTGKSALISVELYKPIFGLPFKVTVEVEVKEQDIKCKKIILKIKGVEKVAIPGILTRDAFGKAQKKTEKRSHVTFETEYIVAKSPYLEANSHYAWEYEVNLPDKVQPEYSGKYAKHQYQIQAEILTFGVNPSTEWINLYS